MNENELKDIVLEINRRHHEERVAAIQSHTEALRFATNSLSVPILKEVLIPMVMKLFSFFAVLVLLLVASILGVKWALGDLINFAAR